MKLIKRKTFIVFLYFLIKIQTEPCRVEGFFSPSGTNERVHMTTSLPSPCAGDISTILTIYSAGEKDYNIIILNSNYLT